MHRWCSVAGTLPALLRCPPRPTASVPPRGVLLAIHGSLIHQAFRGGRCRGRRAVKPCALPYFTAHQPSGRSAVRRAVSHRPAAVARGFRPSRLSHGSRARGLSLPTACGRRGLRPPGGEPAARRTPGRCPLTLSLSLLRRRYVIPHAVRPSAAHEPSAVGYAPTHATTKSPHPRCHHAVSGRLPVHKPRPPGGGRLRTSLAHNHVSPPTVSADAHGAAGHHATDRHRTMTTKRMRLKRANTMPPVPLRGVSHALDASNGRPRRITGTSPSIALRTATRTI